MNNISLSKSTYCTGIQCEKRLWLRRYKPYTEKQTDINPTLETGKEVGELAKKLFGETMMSNIMMIMM